jgi:hypothetical protein
MLFFSFFKLLRYVRDNGDSRGQLNGEPIKRRVDDLDGWRGRDGINLYEEKVKLSWLT